MYISNVPSHRRAQSPSGYHRECVELAACDFAAKMLGVYGEIKGSAHCAYLDLYKNNTPEIWGKIILQATTLSSDRVLARATVLWHSFYGGSGYFGNPNDFNPDDEEDEYEWFIFDSKGKLIAYG